MSTDGQAAPPADEPTPAPTADDAPGRWAIPSDAAASRPTDAAASGPGYGHPQQPPPPPGYPYGQPDMPGHDFGQSPGYGQPLGQGQPPGYGPPPATQWTPPGGPPGYPGTAWNPRPVASEPLAVWSLACGIFGFFAITTLPGIGLGVAALSRIRRSGNAGRAMAIAGIVLSVSWLLVLTAVGVAAMNWAKDEPAQAVSTPTTSTTSTDTMSGTSSASAEPLPEGAQTIKAWTVRVGDCLYTEPDDNTDTFTIIDCNQRHYAEDYAHFDLPEGAYPGDDAVYEAADAGCKSRFEDFVGLPYYDSDLLYTYYPPNSQSWADGDRQVWCFIYQFKATTVGSLAGANR